MGPEKLGSCIEVAESRHVSEIGVVKYSSGRNFGVTCGPKHHFSWHLCLVTMLHWVIMTSLTDNKQLAAKACLIFTGAGSGTQRNVSQNRAGGSIDR